MNAAVHPVHLMTVPATPLATTWWPVALSEQVRGDKPLGIVCGELPLVLFRDGQGAVQVLEDRCPHRRAPLSLGRITAEGRLQCGYHGWTFDGATGACTAIPNLSATEKVPPRYAALALRSLERDGFVWVHAGTLAAPEGAVPPLPRTPAAHSGSVTVSLEHSRYVQALLDDPQLLLSLPGFQITNYTESDPRDLGASVVVERGLVSAARRTNHRFVVDYPWTLRLEIHRDTGLAHLALRDFDDALLMEALLAITPGGRGTTTVCWRAARHARPGALPLKARWQSLRGASPLQVFGAVDGAALSRLPVSGSRLWRA